MGARQRASTAEGRMSEARCPSAPESDFPAARLFLIECVCSDEAFNSADSPTTNTESVLRWFS